MTNANTLEVAYKNDADGIRAEVRKIGNAYRVLLLDVDIARSIANIRIRLRELHQLIDGI